MVDSDRRVYIAALAAEVDRRENTIRSWCRAGRLPEHLRPQRAATDSGPGWRYWTPEQVEAIKQWMLDERMAPGAGLKNFAPTPEQTESLLARLRAKKSPETEE